MKKYKNKKIWDLYSLQYAFLVAGMVMTLIAVLLVSYGLLATPRLMQNQCTYEEVLEKEGNLAGHAATFEVVEDPVKVGEYGNGKHGHYYLVTNGERYIISKMSDNECDEISGWLQQNGSYKLEGITYYIADKDEREEIAENVSRELGANITADNLQDKLGAVQITFTKFNYLSMFVENYIANIIFGGVIILFGLPLLLGFRKELRGIRRITSLSGITADDIDRESMKKGARWLSSIKIYLTKDMLVGLRTDYMKDYDDQVALRYEDICSVYGYNAKRKYGMPSSAKGRYLVCAEAKDGRKYVLSDSTLFGNSRDADVSDDSIVLFKELEKRAPHIATTPANGKYQVFRYPFYVYLSEGKYAEGTEAYEKLGDFREELEWRFEQDNLKQYYPIMEAIFKMSMAFKEDGFVEITVGYFEEYEEQIRADMDEFLQGQLKDGWGADEASEDDEIVVFCQK